MTRTQTILAVAFAGLLAGWGCSQAPTSTGSRTLETRVTKLEQELKAAEAARDAAKVDIAKTADKLAKEVSHAVAVEKDRDDLRAQLKAKASEKEVLQTQLDGFKKGLKDLLGQMETTTAMGSAQGALGAAVAVPERAGF